MLHLSVSWTIDFMTETTNDKSDSLDHLKNLSDQLPPLEIVRQMIEYETQLRLSESVQELLDLYHENDDAIT